MGAFCQITTISSVAISPSRTFSLKGEEINQLPAWQPYEQTHKLQALSWTKGGAILSRRVFFCFCLFFKVDFYSDCFAVCLSYTLFSLGNATRMIFFPLPLMQLSVNHPTVSHLSNQSHAATKPLRESLQCAEIIQRKHISNCWCFFPPFLLFFLHTADSSLVVHFHLKTMRLSDLTFHSYKCRFFLLYLVHVYIVSCIAQQRNNIKCIIFVVLRRLCVIHPSPTVTRYWERAIKSIVFCAQYSSSQIRLDSLVIEPDIYLYSPYCAGQMK